MIRDQRSALIQLFVAEILIGSVGIFVEEGGRDAVTSVFFRCVFGSLFLIAWGLKTGQLQGVLSDRALVRGAIFSGVLLVLNWVALFAGMARSSIGVATMVYHFFPFAMLAFAALFYGERTRRPTSAGRRSPSRASRSPPIPCACGTKPMRRICSASA